MTVKADKIEWVEAGDTSEGEVLQLNSLLPLHENRHDFNYLRFRELQDIDLELCWRKNNSYGKENINAFGLIGVVIRMNDKMERLKNLLFDKQGNPRPLNEVPEDLEDETMLDTLGDLSNYGAIARMVAEGTW